MLSRSLRRFCPILSRDEIIARQRTLDNIERRTALVNRDLLPRKDPEYFLANHPDPAKALEIRKQMEELALMIEKMDGRQEPASRVLVFAASMFLASSVAYTLFQLSDINTSISASLPSVFTVLDYSKARKLLCALARMDLLPVDFASEDPYLIRVFGGSSRNPKVRPIRLCVPIGLAAGIDVDCSGPASFMKLGFGSVEVGTVTVDPSLPSHTDSVELIPNGVARSYGRAESSIGLSQVSSRLCSYLEGRTEDYLTRNTVTGLSIAVNSTDDITRVFSQTDLIDKADYISLDVSGIEDVDSLVGLVKSIDLKSGKCGSIPPMFLKVNLKQSLPPSKEFADAVKRSQAVIGVNVDGSAVAKVHVDSPKFRAEEDVLISGYMVKEKGTEAVSNWYTALGAGSRGKEIIASGGVFTGKDALEKIEAGASMVNVFSSFVLHGPAVARRIKTQLSVQLMNKGYYNLDEAIGAKHREPSKRLKEAMKRRKRF